MAIDLNELLALPTEERMKLAEMLMEGAAPPDIGPLLRQLVTGLERTNRALSGTARAGAVRFPPKLAGNR